MIFKTLNNALNLYFIFTLFLKNKSLLFFDYLQRKLYGESNIFSI